MSALAHARPTRVRGRLLLPQSDAGYRAHLATYGPLPAFARRDRGLLAEIAASGLTGRGGGAFPTAAKLESVARFARTRVIANGTEGEPASAKDATLLARNPHLVLDGLALAARLVGARETAIVVGAEPAAAVRALDRAIDERPAAVQPKLVVSPDRFVAGEESAVVSTVVGGDAKPTGHRPFETGVLVQNVETLAHLALVARHGADWFRAVGTETEPGTALATVGGAVATPGVVEFELGTTLGRLVERCGGLAEPIDAVLVGGYFGRWIHADRDLVLTEESLRSVGGALGARVIVLLPKASCGLVEIARVARYMAAESAGQCGPCVFGLAALGDELDALARARDVDAALLRIPRLEAQIARRGACAHPDGTLGFVTSGLEVFADEVELHRRGMCSATSHAPVLSVPTSLPAR